MFVVRNEAVGEFARTQRLGAACDMRRAYYYGKYEKSNQRNSRKMLRVFTQIHRASINDPFEFP